MLFVVILVMMQIIAMYGNNALKSNVKFKTTDGEYLLYWTNDYVAGVLTMQLCKRTHKNTITTMIGIGFSDHGEVTNADVLIVDAQTFILQDMHTNQEGRLIQDKKNNYKMLTHFRNYKMTCFYFERKWDTCDKNDYLIDRGTTNILLFTSERLRTPRKFMLLSALKPMVVYLQLIRSTMPVNIVNYKTPFVDILVGRRWISNSDTTYWCKVVKLPNFRKKNHIIKYEAIITEKSQGIVHHMELFHCQEAPSEELLNYNAPCNSETKPMGLTMCRKVIAAWAMGAGPFTYPKDVGYPIGGEEFVQYAILEIHYNNPQRLSGIIDNSGMRIYYTPQLRKFDAGIMEIGLDYVDRNSIPPRQKEFTLTGFCAESCLQQALHYGPGIFVFASQLHTHLTGIKVETRHMRFDRELPPLNVDLHYQPHYQEIRLLPEVVHVLTGDALFTSCTYNTLSRSKMTLGGIAISDEMCVNYIFYYPRIELELCKSSLSWQILEGYFRGPLTNVRESFDKIRWTPMEVKELEQIYRIKPIDVSCNKSDGTSLPLDGGRWQFIKPTTMLKHPEKQNNCSHADFESD